MRRLERRSRTSLFAVKRVVAFDLGFVLRVLVIDLALVAIVREKLQFKTEGAK
jgi:hypothetical protein